MSTPVPWAICKLERDAAAAKLAPVEEMAPDLAAVMPGALTCIVPADAVARVSAWFTSMDHPGAGAPAYLFALGERDAFVVARFGRPGTVEDGVTLCGRGWDWPASKPCMARPA